MWTMPTMTRRECLLTLASASTLPYLRLQAQSAVAKPMRRLYDPEHAVHCLRAPGLRRSRR